MDGKEPCIDEILTAYTAARIAQLTGRRRARVEAADARLRHALEVEAERILLHQDLAVLRMERAVQPEGALVRTMHAEDLVFALALCLTPAWLFPDRLDRQEQLRHAEGLLRQVIAWGLIDPQAASCPLIDARIAIDRARRRLREAA